MVVLVDGLPREFGRYRLLELIAIGGMAEVYRAALATAFGTEKELCLKRVLPHLAQNREFIDMFTDEARITLPLSHGNIVQVFEFGQVGGDYFLAMEFVRGRNLETVLSALSARGEPCPLAVALFVAAEVAQGLDYAHRFRDAQDRPTGIIHRDVSPQNILLGYQGEVKLTDFGIAKARSRIRQTAQGIIRGKACYLSPEQAECRELDGRSDVFSLGIVLYEMLTGVRLFEGENELVTLQKVREAKFVSARERRPEIPEEVDGLLRRALERDLDRRVQSAAEFQAALAHARVRAAPDFTPAQFAEWMRRLFAEDISREVATRTTRDRLLRQMAAEQGLDPERLSPKELLRLGTVSMRKPADRPRRRRWLWVPALLAAALAAVFFLRPPGPHSSAETDGGQDAFGAVPDGGGEPADAGVAFEPEAGANGDAGAAEADGAALAGPDADAGDDAGTAPPSDPAPARWGLLNINSDPWALVELDGRRLPRETPLFRVRVREGTHQLRFVNPRLNIEKTVTVRVVAGELQTVSVRLNEP